MIVGIDASNIRAGGGVTHLVELLRAAQPQAHGFSRVVVWGGQASLARIEERPWLVKSHQQLLDKRLPWRAFWQRYRLSRLARSAGCAVLFVPGGSYAGDFHPVVTMSRNLLPFEWRELRRFGWSWLTVKLLLLRMVQARTLRRADGIIFLTRYARDVVMRVIRRTDAETTIIPHGIDARFLQPPREQFPAGYYSTARPLRLVYVSIVDMYKHQWHVAEAVALLRRNGTPVALELIGPAYPAALKRLNAALARLDPAGAFIRYAGAVAHAALHLQYAHQDVCLFASSCENMPNILLEGMASGLPIACSNRGPMPEVLCEAGLYFDPESAGDIARALGDLIASPELRARLAHASFERARAYSWSRCAGETFRFLAHSAAQSVC